MATGESTAAGKYQEAAKSFLHHAEQLTKVQQLARESSQQQQPRESVEKWQVDYLMQVRELSKDHELAGSRRNVKTNNVSGQESVKQLTSLMQRLKQRDWKKKADMGQAETLIAAGRDRELCNMIEKDMAMSSSDIHSPALLWCSAPSNSARLRVPANSVLPPTPSDVMRGHHYEKRERIIFSQKRMTTEREHAEARQLESMGSKMQASPWLSAGIAEAEAREDVSRVRKSWASASGIGSLGTLFGTANSIFVSSDGPARDAIRYGEDARPGLRTVSPAVFGLVSIASKPEASASNSTAVRSPERTPRLQGAKDLLTQTSPRLRSPRQHALERSERKASRGFAEGRGLQAPTHLDFQGAGISLLQSPDVKSPAISQTDRLPPINPHRLSNSLPCLISTPESNLLSPRNNPPPLGTLDAPEQPYNAMQAASPPPLVKAVADPQSSTLGFTHYAPVMQVARDSRSLVHALSGALLPEPGTHLRPHRDPGLRTPAPPHSPPQVFVVPGSPPSDAPSPSTPRLHSPHPLDPARAPSVSAGSSTPRPLTGHSAASIPRELPSRGSIRSPSFSPEPAPAAAAASQTPRPGSKGRALALRSRPVSRDTASRPPSSTERQRAVSRHTSRTGSRPLSRGASSTSKPESTAGVDHVRQFFETHPKEFLASALLVDDARQGAEGWASMHLHLVQGFLFAAAEGAASQLCHRDDLFVLQERATPLQPLALDLIIEEQFATVTTPVKASLSRTTARLQPGDRVHVFASASASASAAGQQQSLVQFRGKKGLLPADALRVDPAPVPRALTLAFAAAADRAACVAALQGASPRARIACEPRSALLDTLAAQQRLPPAASAVRSRHALLQHVRGASLQLLRTQRALRGTDATLSALHARATALGRPRSALKLALPSRTPSATHDHRPHSDRPHSRTSHSTPRSSPSRNTSSHGTGARPAPPSRPRTSQRDERAPPSRLQSGTSGAGRAHAAQLPGETSGDRGSASSSRRSRRGARSGAMFETCRQCQRHAHVTRATRTCVRCLLEAMASHLNEGDLGSAKVASGQVQMLLEGEGEDEKTRERMRGEREKAARRHGELQARIADAVTLSHKAKFFAAAQCGDLKGMLQLVNQHHVDPAAPVGEVEWVDGKGFLKAAPAFVGFCAVHFAAMPTAGVERGDKVACLRYLIEVLGLDAHLPSKDKRTAMHVAVCESPCLRYLVEECGGNPNTLDVDGRTVLHHAALYGKLECLIFLVAEGVVNASATDGINKTAADYEPLVASLLKKSSNLKRVTKFWKGAIVMKCFVRWSVYRRDPEETNQPKPPLAERRMIHLPQPSARMRLYKQWYKNGTPFVVSGEATAAPQLPGSPPGAGGAVALFTPFTGGMQDFSHTFNQSLESAELARSVNVSMAIQGMRLSLSEFTTHYDEESTIKSTKTGKFFCLPATGKWSPSRPSASMTQRSTPHGLYFESGKFVVPSTTPKHRFAASASHQGQSSPKEPPSSNTQTSDHRASSPAMDVCQEDPETNLEAQTQIWSLGAIEHLRGVPCSFGIL